MRETELASAEANAANGTVPRLLTVCFRYVCSVVAVHCGLEAKVKLVFIKRRNESWTGTVASISFEWLRAVGTFWPPLY